MGISNVTISGSGTSSWRSLAPRLGLTAILITLAVGSARADDWVARDKANHFTMSAMISAHLSHSGCGLGLTQNRTLETVVLSLGLGFAKETYDDFQPDNRFSWRDMTWNVLGTLAGIALGPNMGSGTPRGLECGPLPRLPPPLNNLRVQAQSADTASYARTRESLSPLIFAPRATAPDWLAVADAMKGTSVLPSQQHFIARLAESSIDQPADDLHASRPTAPELRLGTAPVSAALDIAIPAWRSGSTDLTPAPKPAPAEDLELVARLSN